MSQNDPKTTSLMTSLTKKNATPNQKFFFECRLEDCLIRMSLWQLYSAIGRGARALARQL